MEQEFLLHEEFITLGQLLKAAGVLGTGGEVRFYLAENEVLVNGEPEVRRGRKLRGGARGLEQRPRGRAVESGVIPLRESVVASGHLALSVVPQECSRQRCSSSLAQC